jgi:hypothetical protein
MTKPTQENTEELQDVWGHNALHQFASTLTTRAQELSESERTYQIASGQATAILTSMIENFVYAAVKTIEGQRYERYRVDVAATRNKVLDEVETNIIGEDEVLGHSGWLQSQVRVINEIKSRQRAALTSLRKEQ